MALALVFIRQNDNRIQLIVSCKWALTKPVGTVCILALSLMMQPTSIDGCAPASSAGPRCIMGRSHTIWRGPAESCKKNDAGVTSANEFLHNLEYKQAIKKRRETCKLNWRL